MGAHVSVPMYHRSLATRVGMIGRVCRRCDTVSFPTRRRCPRCLGYELDELALSGDGAVHAWTRIEAAGAPPEFASFAAAMGSYLVGIVDLDEGPRVTGMLTGFDTDPPIGALVRVMVRRLYSEEGVIRYGFKFAPRLDSWTGGREG